MRPQFVPPVGHPIVTDEIKQTVRLLQQLRRVRDSGDFRKEGAHNFREWAMKQFGDRIGIMLDESL